MDSRVYRAEPEGADRKLYQRLLGWMFCFMYTTRCLALIIPSHPLPYLNGRSSARQCTTCSRHGRVTSRLDVAPLPGMLSHDDANTDSLGRSFPCFTFSEDRALTSNTDFLSTTSVLLSFSCTLFQAFHAAEMADLTFIGNFPALSQVSVSSSPQKRAWAHRKPHNKKQVLTRKGTQPAHATSYDEEAFNFGRGDELPPRAQRYRTPPEYTVYDEELAEIVRSS